MRKDPVKTLFVLRYLQQPELRKRVSRRLNKGESLHALSETVHFAHRLPPTARRPGGSGPVPDPVANCVAAFNAGLLTPAVEQQQKSCSWRRRSRLGLRRSTTHGSRLAA